ncbi:MAG: hypothetical protein U0744_02280 [Gemmataceae bacterium]
MNRLDIWRRRLHSEERHRFCEPPSWNLVASDDEWTSPIVAEVGPDGCMWVVDWYSFIVQHNPTPAVRMGERERLKQITMNPAASIAAVPKNGKIGKTRSTSIND